MYPSRGSRAGAAGSAQPRPFCRMTVASTVRLTHSWKAVVLGDKPLRRRDWADLVAAHLDATLVPRGFQLAREEPQDVVEDPMARYWAYPDDYARRFPRIGAGYEGDITDVCLWVGWSDGGGVMCELEALYLEEWFRELGMIEQLQRWEERPIGVEAQLSELALALRGMLDAASAPD